MLQADSDPALAQNTRQLHRGDGCTVTAALTAERHRDRRLSGTIEHRHDRMLDGVDQTEDSGGSQDRSAHIQVSGGHVAQLWADVRIAEVNTQVDQKMSGRRLIVQESEARDLDTMSRFPHHDPAVLKHVPLEDLTGVPLVYPQAVLRIGRTAQVGHPVHDEVIRAQAVLHAVVLAHGVVSATPMVSARSSSVNATDLPVRPERVMALETTP